ncbi:hypothetical protein FACS1894171_1250 [Clostridia bacterium]|nr:hypothetical protein FACS1894171_1250 [Clostridia bacterium]
MIFCEQCGSQIEEEAVFCPECGAAVTVAEEPGPSPTCPSCGAALAEGAVFCPECGAAVTVAEEPGPSPTCPSCGAALAEGAVFCPECGAAVTVAEEPEPSPTCPSCGAALAEGAVFCPECGASVMGTPIPAADYAPPRTQYQESAAQIQAGYGYPQPAGPVKSKKPLIIGLVLGAVVLVVAALILILTLRDPSDIIPTPLPTPTATVTPMPTPMPTPTPELTPVPTPTPETTPEPEPTPEPAVPTLNEASIGGLWVSDPDVDGTGVVIQILTGFPDFVRWFTYDNPPASSDVSALYEFWTSGTGDRNSEYSDGGLWTLEGDILTLNDVGISYTYRVAMLADGEMTLEARMDNGGYMAPFRYRRIMNAADASEFFNDVYMNWGP